MTAAELFEIYAGRYNIRAQYDAWSFGSDADALASLVCDGIKTATSSAYALYALENEPLPREGEYSVILDSQGEAVCIIKNIRVYTVPFSHVSAEQAYKEGEGDRSLEYWRRVHREFFTVCMAEAGLEFSEDMSVVCEEFMLVFSAKSPL